MKREYPTVPSYYRLTTISKAAGILSSKKKSERRGITTKDPRLKKPLLVSCYHFRIKDQSLSFRISKKDKVVKIPLASHSVENIEKEGIEVRSFTLTPTSLSLSIRKEVTPFNPECFLGIDRNASNVTCGNMEKVVLFELKKVEEISKSTRDVMRSLKRNDVRITKLLATKYGRRKSERVNQILHKVSKNIVDMAKNNHGAITFENIDGLRHLYRKGNYQGKSFRARMNSVPWYEIKRQIEYKAAWDGVPVIQLTKGETRGTSKICPVCGVRLQEDRFSRAHRREIWCSKCGRWCDRDVVVVMNISHRGWLRFRQSNQGEASEAMVQELCEDGVILKVDASKLSRHWGDKLLALLLSTRRRLDRTLVSI
jgi:putative transposase